MLGYCCCCGGISSVNNAVCVDNAVVPVVENAAATQDQIFHDPQQILEIYRDRNVAKRYAVDNLHSQAATSLRYLFENDANRSFLLSGYRLWLVTQGIATEGTAIFSGLVVKTIQNCLERLSEDMLQIENKLRDSLWRVFALIELCSKWNVSTLRAHAETCTRDIPTVDDLKNIRAWFLQRTCSDNYATIDNLQFGLVFTNIEDYLNPSIDRRLSMFLLCVRHICKFNDYGQFDLRTFDCAALHKNIQNVCFGVN
ncbi:hypothetical protein FACS1894113_0590 [Alphaproteobacteria bacterium]|nr:hypothetical protein FACS1894113_0590 [Alphaproteobacteria bacterium]